MTSNELTYLPSAHDNLSDLRPRSMGQIIDQAIRLYRRNFARFLGIAAIAQIPAALGGFMTLGMTAMPFVDQFSNQYSEAMAMGMALLNIAFMLIALVWTQLVGCVLLQSASDTYVGRRTTLGASFHRVGRSWMAVITAYLLFILAAIPIFIVFVIPIVGWLLAIPGFGMYIYFATVVMAFFAPVIVLEKRGARAGIARAWNLSRTNFWWLFAFFILLSIFAALITQGPTYLLSELLALIGDGILNIETMVVFNVLISSLFAVLFYPIQITSATLAYYDTRIRSEGLDLALQTVVLDDEADHEDPKDTDPEDALLGAIDTVIRNPPPTDQRFRPTGSEWRSFSLITLGVAGLMILLIAVVMGIELWTFSGF